jgi:circadian clock protein KaiC
VFPRLVASEHHEEFADDELASGVKGVDELLGGGLPLGSSTLYVGPSGVGKSTVAMQFAIAAARRGERSAVFIFDETVGIVRARARKLGMELDRYLDSGLITVRQVDPAELSPGEFAAAVRRAVEGSDESGKPARLVMIDSLNGYLHSMPEEKMLGAQLHELFTYLNQKGVCTMATLAQAGMVGSSMRAPVDTTYLADNVILFRYFEDRGHVRRAISVLKKRSGRHELTIREMWFNERGIELSGPLEQFQGILQGTPTLVRPGDGAVDDDYGTTTRPGGRAREAE